MTESQIRFNFEQARRQAQRLDDIARDMDRNVVRAIEDSVQTLSSAWKGESASAYLRKEDVLKGKIAATASNLRDIADEIRTISKRLYDTEMRAVMIARTK